MPAVLVLVIAAAWFCSALALGPCDQSIINGLSTVPECYPEGKAPNQKAGSSLGTYIVVPKGAYPTDSCLTGNRVDSHGYVYVYSSNGTLTYTHQRNQQYYDTYIDETDDQGNKYKIYVIRNANAVYAYYICDPDLKSSGEQEVFVAVGCAYATNAAVLKIVETVKTCFDKLNIKNYVSQRACDC